MPKPKVTEEEAFRNELVMEDLSSYGPVSKVVEKKLSPERKPISPERSIVVSERNPDFVGNRDIKE